MEPSKNTFVFLVFACFVLETLSLLSIIFQELPIKKWTRREPNGLCFSKGKKVFFNTTVLLLFSFK